jgi:hypothetical protein
MNEAQTGVYSSARPVPQLLRVAAVQLPRLEPEDRAALRKYVERDLTEASNG